MTVYSFTFLKLKMFEDALEMASTRLWNVQIKSILLSSGLQRFISSSALGFPAPHNGLSISLDGCRRSLLTFFPASSQINPALPAFRLIFLKHSSNQTPLDRKPSVLPSISYWKQTKAHQVICSVNLSFSGLLTLNTTCFSWTVWLMVPRLPCTFPSVISFHFSLSKWYHLSRFTENITCEIKSPLISQFEVICQPGRHALYISIRSVLPWFRVEQRKYFALLCFPLFLIEVDASLCSPEQS